MIGQSANDASSQLVKMIRSKYTELEYLFNKSLKNLEKQLEQIISRLVEYQAKVDDLQECFPYELLKEKLDKIYSQIQMSMQLDIEQLFMNRPNKIMDQNLKIESIFDKNTKIKMNINSDHYVFQSLGNPLDQNQQYSLTFLIDNLTGDIAFGLCDLQIMKNKKSNLTTVGSGAYVLFQDRFVIHSDNPDLNWKVLGLKFEVNDKILVNYFPEAKKIQWIKVNTQESYEYNIVNNQSQLNFCVVMKHAGTVVSILQ